MGKVGRPKKDKKQKIKTFSVYLTVDENDRIKDKYETPTIALRKVVLPKCK